MKKILFLYLITLPFFGFAQTDTVVISLDMEKDSTFNFIDANKSMYDFIYSNIDTSLEKGVLPREKAYVRWLFTKDGDIDTVIVNSDYENLKLELSNAMGKIDRLIFPAIEKDIHEYEFILKIERWQEVGELRVSGFLSSKIN